MTTIQNNLSTGSSTAVNKSMQQISTGKRINSAADDAAGLAVATRFSSQISGNQQAQRNVINAQSLIQTEDGALQGVTSGLQRLQELAIQQGNGILNDSDRETLNKEADQIKTQIQQITEQSQFNGKPLFQEQQNAAPFQFQTGENTTDITELSANTLAEELNSTLSELDFASGEDLLNGITALQNTVDERRTELGAISNRLDSVSETLAKKEENTQAARSRIEDADLAKSVSEMIKGQIQQQAQISAQLQANASAENVLQLLS